MEGRLIICLSENSPPSGLPAGPVLWDLRGGQEEMGKERGCRGR